MTTDQPAAPQAGDKPGAAAGARGRLFALPASTSFRFALLIAAVVASSIMGYEGIYLATPRGPALIGLLHRCLARALSPPPHGEIAYSRALNRAAACRAGAERAEGVWVLAGIAALGVLAGALYYAQPWWLRRRMRLRPPGSVGTAALLDRLEQLRLRAGTGPVTWLLQPFNTRQSAFAFGHFRRRYVAVSAGAVVAAGKQPAVFDAVVLHELGHIRNSDIDQTYLTVAIWRAFVVAVLLPMAWVLVFSRVLGPPVYLLWRVAALALIVYLLRNSILRSREFGADARVAELDPGTSLGEVLAGQPPRRSWRDWHLGWVHPSGQERIAALADPAPLYRCGFWDGLAVGLVAAMGAEAAQQLVYLLFTASHPVTGLVPGGIFALLCGPAIAVAIWRMRFLQPETAAARGWPAGLGLGIGLALGPIVAVSTAGYQGVAPNSLRLSAIAALAAWTALVTLIFGSFPVWIGHWADPWQRRAGRTAARVPARAGLLAAAIGAWVVLATGLALLLAGFTFVEGSAAAIANFLTQMFMFDGTTPPLEVWAICLVFFAVPLAAEFVHRRGAGGSGAKGTAWRGARNVALPCLAGGLTAVAAVTAVAAFTHAHTAAPLRWSAIFAAQLWINGEQVVVVTAAVFASIAAATMKSRQTVTIALAVAGVVAALGGLVAVNMLPISSCAGPLSIEYTHPPASMCQGLFGGTFLAEQTLFIAAEAVLVSILLVPAVNSARAVLASRSPRPGGAVLWWLAAGTVAVMVIGSAGLRAVQAGADGVQVLGSIGNDGWIRGTGYEFRLLPGWYDRSPTGNRGTIVVQDQGHPTATIKLYTSPVSQAPAIAQLMLRHGARAAPLGGVRGLRVLLSGHEQVMEQWAVAHSPFVYVVIFADQAADRAYSAPGVADMLQSWHWTAGS